MVEAMLDRQRRTGTALRERIPQLRAGQAEALRQLFASPVCWPLQNERMLALAPLRRPGGVGGAFELDGDGTRVALRLDGSGSQATTPQWSDYSGRARLLAWSLAHEQALVQLSEALGLPLLPVAELAPDAAADRGDDGVWLAFSVEDMYEPDEPGVAGYYQSGELRLPAPWLQRMLGRAEPVDPERPQPELAAWAQLPAPVSVACAGPRLTASAWAALRPGDVFVLGSRTQPPPLHARANGRQWPLRANHDGCRIDGAMQTIPTLLESSAMNENEAPPPQDAPADDGGDAATRSLPVLVEFELGRLELTLGELAGLQPGYVFPLPAFVEGANVTIRANGRASGRGELVAVGDTLGVRLVSWN